MISVHNDVFNFSTFIDDVLTKVITSSFDIEFVSQESSFRLAEASSTPFATNSVTTSNGRFQIVYNNELIGKCGFDKNEIFSMLMHEIGHLDRAEANNEDDSFVIDNEIRCDNYATRAGLGLSLATALIKNNEYATVYYLSERLKAISLAIDCYRPEWTCGRYNSICHSAIFYNLIEGWSYYFEDASADVVGQFIDIPRNTFINISRISESTGISVESLFPFIQSLSEVNLISLVPVSTKLISSYRNYIAQKRVEHGALIDAKSSSHLPVDSTNAEILYSERVGGITSIMLELTYRCSERCIHCYNPGATRNNEESSGRANFEELSLEEYKRVIDEFYEKGLVKVCISGGDPFSKSCVWDILDYLYSRNIAIDIFTNGQSIAEKDSITRLAALYPRLVGVSIYSGIEKDHDYITRVKGSWDKSIYVLSMLTKHAIPIDLKCCVIRTNLNSYHSIVDLAHKYGATPQIEVCVADSVEGDKCVSRYLRLKPEELEIVLRDQAVPMYVGHEVPNYGGEQKNLDRFACGAGRNSLCVTPDGDIIPCCALHLSFGNVREQSVDSIISSEARNKWLSLMLRDYTECGRHDYCDFCNLCPGVNYSEHNTPLKPGENNCYMAKVRYNLHLKLKQCKNDPLNGRTIEEALSELDNTYPDIKRELGQSQSPLKN